MQLTYATRYRCDICQAEAGIALINTMGAPPPVPDGWQQVPGGMQFPDGRFGRDFCPACLQLPFGTVLEKMRHGD